ncbi:hypothetical protein HDV00_011291 [Rhizophlyctis rosea]|nr:hypothetical protein HDV00_011291 [Rhizophlyctis rosea]
MTKAPLIVFGGGAFWDGNEETGKTWLQTLERLGITHIDTARIYGESETVLGNLGAPKKFNIDTKVPFGPKAQTKEAVFAAQKASFSNLKVDKVDIYYLHGPDSETPIEETLDAVQQIYTAGHFKRFGLSNFKPDAVEKIHAYNSQKGYVLPTVFQGNYNPVSRHIEEDLFPVLRRLNISFYVYSAIAGGFLSKTVEQIKAGGEGRWDPNTPLGQMYHKLYNRGKVVEGLEEWAKIAEDASVSRSELAYRFIAFHSAVKADKRDAIIVGASKPEQLEETVKGLGKGPLPQSIVVRIDKVWELVKEDAPYNNAEQF